MTLVTQHGLVIFGFGNCRTIGHYRKCGIDFVSHYNLLQAAQRDVRCDLRLTYHYHKLHHSGEYLNLNMSS